MIPGAAATADRDDARGRDRWGWVFNFLNLLAREWPVDDPRKGHHLSTRRINGAVELVLSMAVDGEYWVLFLDPDDLAQSEAAAVQSVSDFLRTKIAAAQRRPAVKGARRSH